MHAASDTEPPAVNALLRECQQLCTKGEVMAETEEVLQLFNALGFAVAGGRARSLEALATVFNRLGAEPFTEACASLLQLDCTDDLVALAYAACDAQPSCFHRRLLDESGLCELVDEVNLAAQRYEWVPGNASVGRAKVPTCDHTHHLRTTIGVTVRPPQSKHQDEYSCSASMASTSAYTRPSDANLDPERWWWVGPWVGSIMLAWTVTMWWTQHRPARPEPPH